MRNILLDVNIRLLLLLPRVHSPPRHAVVADVPVFERGWPRVPADWRCPEAAALVTPAVQLRDVLHKMVPSSNLLTFDATLWLHEDADDEWRRAVTVGGRHGGGRACCRGD